MIIEKDTIKDFPNSLMFVGYFGCIKDFFPLSGSPYMYDGLLIIFNIFSSITNNTTV